ncbi:uncharacterized protein MYCFIDRAFT_80165 [Pseudocercospora fijiensis CIRAD86]|uniref:BTB domain-containing protein n=1 Tax=Pseudocercospora fijiensis (strain CIRAD86) TaxID=383855 RepID=N1QBY1_PSEFD|nr:uncharacterized protein MYCFIDRAFT_80165 [Pseudocercospora fijiensis CIRAD86]EME88802.1 hypothetical protein MYCFIDRAFT_80165 [Pseudocercospora fijiensis CIRAD86]
MYPKNLLQRPNKWTEYSITKAPLAIRSKKRSRSMTETDGGYDEAPPKKKKFLGVPEEVVRFDVGPAGSSRQLFTVPKKLAVDHSAVVARRCRRSGPKDIVIRLEDHTPETFLLYVDFLFGHLQVSGSSSSFEAGDRMLELVCLHLLVRNVAKHHWPAMRSSSQIIPMVHRIKFVAEVEKASKEMVTLRGADADLRNSSDASKS